MQRGLFLGGQPRLYPKGADPQPSPILGSLIHVCTPVVTELSDLAW